MALPPPTCLEMGAFYPILGAMELSAELLYTTRKVHIRCTFVFSLARWLCPFIKELLEGAVHNLGDAYPFKIGCALNCFNVSLLHVVGFALGLLLRVISHLHS